MFDRLRRYADRKAGEARSFNPDCEERARATMNARDEHGRALAILFRLATERRRPWWAFWRPRFRFHHEPLRNDAANLIRQIGYQQMMHVGDHLVGDVD